MSKIVLTVHEASVDRALAVLRQAPEFVRACEVRLDALSADPPGFEAFREATRKELILTRRGRPFTSDEMKRALDAGVDWIDVELGNEVPEEFRKRVILSHHDFEDAPEVNTLYRRMKLGGAAKRKIALTPLTFSDNERLLTTLATASDPNLTVIGMGANGLFSRILAPFFGSDLIFVARDRDSAAAPGQLTLEQARAIYGEGEIEVPWAIFAVVGNPVNHSLSPELHNPRFREAGIAAAYSMIQVDEFEEVIEAMREESPFAPAGISITAPFKEAAYRFAATRAQMSDRARRCRAVNTLVRLGEEFVADNTDVVGFAAGLQAVAGRAPLAAVIGAGGAARAALVALQDANARVTVYNRTHEKAVALAREFGADAKPLTSLRDFRGDLLVNALPAQVEADIAMRRGAYIDVSYGPGADQRTDRARRAGLRTFDGRQFLAAQAVPQFELFVRAAREAAGHPGESKREGKQPA